MSELHDLTTLVRAATPLLVIETVDEQRVIDCFRHVIAQALRPLWRWTLTDGLQRLDFRAAGVEIAPDATATLDAIRAAGRARHLPAVRLPPLLRYAMTQRQLREIVQRQRCGGAHRRAGRRQGRAARRNWKRWRCACRCQLPGRQGAGRHPARRGAGLAARATAARVEVDNDAARTLVRNLRGLSAPDARRIVRKLIYNDGALSQADLPELMQAKFDLLNRAGLLHYEYDTAVSPTSPASASAASDWVQRRRAVFLGAERRPALDPPKGVLLLGVQGCGKSLAAKAIAGGFGVPLVRLDFGTLYNKYHGETEKNLREALASAELLGALRAVDRRDREGPGRAATSDGGVSRRVLGYLLTWMAERKARVFVVATANAVQRAARRNCCARAASTRSSSSTCPTARLRARDLRACIWRGASSMPALSTCRHWPPPAPAFPARRSSRPSSARCTTRPAARQPLDQADPARRPEANPAAVGADGRTGRRPACLGSGPLRTRRLRRPCLT